MHIWKETFANRRPVNVNVNINYSYLIVNIDGFIRLWTLFIFVRIVIVEINKLFQALFKKIPLNVNVIHVLIFISFIFKTIYVALYGIMFVNMVFVKQFHVRK